MGMTTLNPTKYGRLCADAVPKVIETDQEFDRMVAKMEALDQNVNPTPEEEALSALLGRLIEYYDNQRHPLPHLPPQKMIQFLMDQRGLRQADLLPIFGSRSVISDVVSGKREPSKAQIRKMLEVAPELFAFFDLR